MFKEYISVWIDKHPFLILSPSCVLMYGFMYDHSSVQKIYSFEFKVPPNNFRGPIIQYKYMSWAPDQTTAVQDFTDH